jgi:hypothetical protein
VTQTHTNFLGIPVEGDITRGSSRVEQKPLSELEPLLRAVLGDPRIHTIGWRQYTPYFCDGDPCEFSVGQPWFTTTGLPALNLDEDDPEEDDEYEEGGGHEINSSSPHPTLGGPASRYTGSGWEETPYQGPDEQLWKACKELSDAIEGGAFEDVLLEAFGDHASVRVRATGITVDSYEHS